MKAEKKGFVYCVNHKYEWWDSHLMAPAPMRLDDLTIRIYIGCWSKEQISRIGYIDVDINNPAIVKNICKYPVLEIGSNGCFDDNGVFPAHVYKFSQDKIYLYYTGFQLGDKIPFFNFSGLAVSKDNGNTFERYSKTPVLDRSDEGLFTRAGISIYPDEEGFHCVYSAGSGWFFLNGKERPIYEVFYQKSRDGVHFSRHGEKIVACDLEIEHGLGRPQIIKLGEWYYVFYTRRIIKGMNYFLGCTRTKDFIKWERMDSVFNDVPFGEEGEFDNKMIYFPGVLQVSEHKAFCFYTGNHYGETGIGYIVLNF